MMATAIGDLIRWYRETWTPQRVSELESELVPGGDAFSQHAEKVAAAIFERTGLAPSEYKRLDASGKLVWLEKAFDKQEPNSPRKRGTKKAKTRKIDVAITLVVRDPQLADAEIARMANCDPSYLSRNKDYKRNAAMARAALVRARRGVTFNQRTGEHEALDD